MSYRFTLRAANAICSSTIRVALGLLLFGLAASAPVTRAQGQPTLAPTQVRMSDTAEGLHLEMFFSVRDEAGQPKPLTDMQPVRLQLHEGEEPLTVPPEPSTAPIKLLLLLDESGSMADYAGQLRRAVLGAIQAAPDKAELAILKFSDVPDVNALTPTRDFTSDRDSLGAWITNPQNYDPRAGNPTCLYNAALGSINYLNRLSGDERRAIILFTDGRDERTRGGPPCSQGTTAEAVIRAATEDSGTATPIYTVGLCPVELDDGVCPASELDSVILQNLASGTGGTAKINTPSGLIGAFGGIMSDIKNQVFVSALLQPCGEPFVTVITSVYGIDQPVKRNVPLRSERCYTPRAVAGLDEPSPLPWEYTFEGSLKNTSPITLTSYTAKVIGPDNQKNTEIRKDFLLSPGESQPITLKLSAAELRDAGSYTLKLYASGEGNIAFRREPGEQRYATELYKGEALDVLAEFVWTHTPVQINYAPQSIQVQPHIAGTTTLTATLQMGVPKVYTAVLDKVGYRAEAAGEGCVLGAGPPAASHADGSTEVTLVVPLDASVASIGRDLQCRLTIAALPPPEALTAGEDGVFAMDPVPFTLHAARWQPNWPLIGGLAGGLLLVVALAAVVLRPRSEPIPQPRPFNESTGEVILEEVRPASRPTRLNLRVTKTPDGRDQRSHTVELPCEIGRKEGTVVIAGDDSISRRHARLVLFERNLYIEDLGTKNGTLVEGNEVARGGRQVLKLPATVRLGRNTIIRVEALPE